MTTTRAGPARTRRPTRPAPAAHRAVGGPGAAGLPRLLIPFTLLWVAPMVFVLVIAVRSFDDIAAARAGRPAATRSPSTASRRRGRRRELPRAGQQPAGHRARGGAVARRSRRWPPSRSAATHPRPARDPAGHAGRQPAAAADPAHPGRADQRVPRHRTTRSCGAGRDPRRLRPRASTPSSCTASCGRSRRRSPRPRPSTAPAPAQIYLRIMLPLCRPGARRARGAGLTWIFNDLHLGDHRAAHRDEVPGHRRPAQPAGRLHQPVERGRRRIGARRRPDRRRVLRLPAALRLRAARGSRASDRTSVVSAHRHAAPYIGRARTRRRASCCSRAGAARGGRRSPPWARPPGTNTSWRVARRPRPGRARPARGHPAGRPSPTSCVDRRRTGLVRRWWRVSDSRRRRVGADAALTRAVRRRRPGARRWTLHTRPSPARRRPALDRGAPTPATTAAVHAAPRDVRRLVRPGAARRAAALPGRPAGRRSSPRSRSTCAPAAAASAAAGHHVARLRPLSRRAGAGPRRPARRGRRHGLARSPGAAPGRSSPTPARRRRSVRVSMGCRRRARRPAGAPARRSHAPDVLGRLQPGRPGRAGPRVAPLRAHALRRTTGAGAPAGRLQLLVRHRRSTSKPSTSSHSPTSPPTLGAEVFVVDDGWFTGRDRRHARARRLDTRPGDGSPAGWTRSSKGVLALGLRFGLWVEPEGVNPDSDLFRAHPDWVYRAGDRPSTTMRNQLVLDLGRAEVVEWIESHADAAAHRATRSPTSSGT